MNRLRAVVYFLCVLLLSPVAVGQTTLLSDDYADGDFLNPAWYKAGPNSTIEIVDDSSGLGTGNAMRINLSPSDNSVFFHSEFPEVTLGEVGDFIEMTFDVRITSLNPSPGFIGNLFRFGFYDVGGTHAADNVNNVLLDFGYMVQADVGGRSGQAFDLRQDRPGAVFNTSYNPDEFGGNASTTNAYAMAYDDPHSVFLRIERTEYVDPFDPGLPVPDLTVTTNIKGPGEEALANITNSVLTGLRLRNPDAQLLTSTFAAVNIGTRQIPVNDVSFTIDNVNVVTNLEVEIPTTPIPGDFNGDDVVDGDDLAEWVSAFGTGPGADADEDGDSDGNDFLIWQRNLGSTPESLAAISAVPEPNSLVLVVAAATAGLWRRRRTR